MTKKTEYDKAYRADDKEQLSEKKKKKRKSRTPEQAERERAYARMYYQKNRDAILEKSRTEESRRKQRAYREKHKDQANAATRKWKKEHKDIVQENRKKTNAIYYAHDTAEECRWQPYSAKDIQMILDKEMPDKQLAIQLGRSVCAIQSMRCIILKRMREQEASEYAMTADT